MSVASGQGSEPTKFGSVRATEVRQDKVECELSGQNQSAVEAPFQRRGWIDDLGDCGHRIGG